MDCTVMQVVKTTIHPKYDNHDGINVDYDIAMHQLASASAKLPARINLGVFQPNHRCSWQTEMHQAKASCSTVLWRHACACGQPLRLVSVSTTCRLTTMGNSFDYASADCAEATLAVLIRASLAADVAAAGEAAGSLLTSLGWGYTQGVVDALSAGGGGAADAGAGLLQASSQVDPAAGRHAGGVQAVVMLEWVLLAAVASGTVQHVRRTPWHLRHRRSSKRAQPLLRSRHSRCQCSCSRASSECCRLPSAW